MPSTDVQLQAFSSSGEDAIHKYLDVSVEQTPPPGSSQFSAHYEVERTAQIIQEGDYKRIALQFPDDLLHDSVPICNTLRGRLGHEREIYVLADTSYGSCCVDEVAASHVEADALVHYGHACLSQTSRLPIIYVFGSKFLNIEECVGRVSSYFTTNAESLLEFSILRLRHDVRYTHVSADLVRLLRLAVGDRFNVEYESIPNMTFPRRADEADTSSNGRCYSAPSTTAKAMHGSSPSRTITLWVGEESSTLTKILMTSSGNTVISYSPNSGVVQEETHLTNKLLMRRYSLLQKARDADVFGILIGTLGVASYLPLVQHLRQRIKKAHKKSYTVSVGKINPSKLANFMEIECWIWVSCSEGMVDSKEYLRPIITPYELELALQPEPDWTGKYIFDFQELLARATLEDEEENSHDIDGDQPMFSLASGKYRQAKRFGDDTRRNRVETPTESRDLTIRSDDNALSRMGDSAALKFIQTRSYQGLDPRTSQDAPSVLEQGRSGIARGYNDDHQNGRFANDGLPAHP